MSFEIDKWGGRAVELAIDPQNPSILYAAISTGLDADLYKSVDGGASWAVANGGLTFGLPHSVAVSPSVPSVVYLRDASNARVFRSSNAGATWQAVGYPEISHIVVELAIDPSNASTIYAGTHGGGVFKTSNHGADWTEANTGLDLPFVLNLEIDPQTTDTLYATAGPLQPGISSRLYRTTEGGERWTPVLIGHPVQAVAIDPEVPSTIYAGRGVAGGGGVLRSVEGGITWKRFGTGLEGESVQVLAIDPLSPWRIYAGTSHGIYVGPVLFADGFESGDASEWSTTFPPF